MKKSEVYTAYWTFVMFSSLSNCTPGMQIGAVRGVGGQGEAAQVVLLQGGPHPHPALDRLLRPGAPRGDAKGPLLRRLPLQ